MATIAYHKLKADNPKALDNANELLQVLTRESPSGFHSKKEGDYPFVECATLADDIKYRGGGWQSDWHFVDLPWFDEGGKPEDYPEFELKPKNLTLAIPEITSWLKEEPGYKDSTVYKTMMSSKRNLTCSHRLCAEGQSEMLAEEFVKVDAEEDAAKSYALRLMIHYMGDIHQPLHCAARVNTNYPKGDKGGNMFPLPFHYETDDLHAVWDSVLYHYHESVKLVSNHFN